MGAWGTGILEDDAALDFLEDELEGDPDPLPTLERVFRTVGPEPDYEEGCAVLVAAHLMRCVIQDEPLDPEEEESEERQQWRQSLATLDLSPLYPLASQALDHVAQPGSELHELWQENEGDFPAWHQQVLDLCDFMDAQARL